MAQGSEGTSQKKPPAGALSEATTAFVFMMTFPVVRRYPAGLTLMFY